MPYSPPSRLPSIALDSPPPSPKPRTKPGDDTDALYGESFMGDGNGIGADTPMGKALGGLSMLMGGVNLVESVLPGSIPPPVIQLIQQLIQTIPEQVRSMSVATGPTALMAAQNPATMMGAGGMSMNPMMSQSMPPRSPMEGMMGM